MKYLILLAFFQNNKSQFNYLISELIETTEIKSEATFYEYLMRVRVFGVPD